MKYILPIVWMAIGAVIALCVIEYFRTPEIQTQNTVRIVIQPHNVSPCSIDGFSTDFEKAKQSLVEIYRISKAPKPNIDLQDGDKAAVNGQDEFTQFLLRLAKWNRVHVFRYPPARGDIAGDLKASKHPPKTLDEYINKLQQ